MRRRCCLPWGLTLYALLGEDFNLSGMAERLFDRAMALIVIWGAFLDIRDARKPAKIARQSEMLEDAYNQVEDLNGTLRAQRHDFKNHLQVVFGLIEMGEYGEAQGYIERVYGDIQRVSRALKTASPAVNALLAAKAADCEERGIAMETRIGSAWQDLPRARLGDVPPAGKPYRQRHRRHGDASLPQRRLVVETGEDLHAFTFRVFNTGPEIPEDRRAAIFERGFTTKGAGRGMGLAIVAEILEENGGVLHVESGAGGNRFRRTHSQDPAGAPLEAHDVGSHRLQASGLTMRPYSCFLKRHPLKGNAF